MITCVLEVADDIEDLYRVFEAEQLKSERASCNIKKGKTLVFEIRAKDPVSMKAFTSSVLSIIAAYEKAKGIAK